MLVIQANNLSFSLSDGIVHSHPFQLIVSKSALQRYLSFTLFVVSIIYSGMDPNAAQARFPEDVGLT